ncbi:MAG TPA: tripartite tricarboxylate transporter permease, partial [Xanthobacteraceae bacterium]
LPLAGVWARLLYVPRHWLYAGILVFAVLGVYGVNRSVFEIGVLGVFGLLGYAMRKLDFPVAPVIVGMILGPMAEVQFRRAIQITQGDLSIFVTRPISLTLLLIAAGVLLGPLISTAFWRLSVAYQGRRPR